MTGSNKFSPSFQTKLYRNRIFLESANNELSIDTGNDISNRFFNIFVSKSIVKSGKTFNWPVNNCLFFYLYLKYYNETLCNKFLWFSAKILTRVATKSTFSIEEMKQYIKLLETTWSVYKWLNVLFSVFFFLLFLSIIALFHNNSYRRCHKP